MSLKTVSRSEAMKTGQLKHLFFSFRIYSQQASQLASMLTVLCVVVAEVIIL